MTEHEQAIAGFIVTLILCGLVVWFAGPVAY
jgi:hypothetical protein